MAVPEPDDDSLPSSLGDALGVAEGAFDTADPVALGRALARAMERAAVRPWSSAPAWLRFGAGLGLVGASFPARLLGIHLPEVASTDPKDARFRAPAWRDNAFFHTMLEAYLLAERLLQELVHAAHLEGPTAPKAAFAAQLVSDAVAPTNFPLTNPTALIRAFETAGGSVVRGTRNFLHDVVENGGWPSQVDRTAFRLGENMAATPGKVVYRNELIEVLQYAPQTEEVHEIPLVVCPPWINRYYIADLAPGKSLVEWSVQRGHTVFAVSYRNPDESMRHLTFDDYLRLGPLSAIDVARSITGSDTVNTLAICLGGTMNAMVLAYLDACGDHLVNSSTYLNSAVDYADAGTLALVFADRDTVEGLVRRMEKTGYLDGKDMAHTFDLLRANDLVFRYVVDGWLLGEKPPAFDLLAWNADSTNMPGKAHAGFIEQMYLENALARDAYVAMGEQLLVSEIATDSYIVAAVEDHIVPWRVSYRTTQLLKGPVRFVLTSAGHIAGIVNPPSPKVRLWTNEELPGDADRWLAGATEHRDTWWNDWADWVSTRAGASTMPPSMGNASYPVLGDAPGTYVRS
ncbi:MAG TPA: alpha/beta fold hydrolase [Acidimicrobiia bacterium]|nr:alpha/beta fold hydrolase [Acidimicrobiia bacterium]